MKESRSFSLLELIITLGILAVVSTMLLDNFADVKARQCSNVTRERGEQVRTVILGEDGHHGISGFLSDMGRLPCIYIPRTGATYDDGDGGRRLAELYDGSIWHATTTETALSHVETIESDVVEKIITDPNLAPGSTLKDATSDPTVDLFYPEITMSVGWRGPYLSHSDPFGGSFYDGWGRGWRIVSNYNLDVNATSHLLEEQWNHADTTKKIHIYGTKAEIEALSSEEHDVRIDGLLSYGGNDKKDVAGTDVSAADEDQLILFAFHADDTGQGIGASLEIELMTENPETGCWERLPEVKTWQSGVHYSVDDVVVAGKKLYWCKTAHDSLTTVSSANFVPLTDATLVHDDPNERDPGMGVKACIYLETYYVKASTSGGTMWKKLGLCRNYPDSLSLLLAVPVKTGEKTTRSIHLGVYHFFRNGTGHNDYNVKPFYLANTTSTAVEDKDCLGKDAALPVLDEKYNKRYLVAEDRVKIGDPWNEFSIRRLIPGHRRLFCMGYNQDIKKSIQSYVETIELRPGSNRVKLYLRSR